MDINIHLTAARYFSFGDLGRIGWMADNNILWPFFFKGYIGVVNAQELTYIIEFRPFSKVDLHIKLLCWDDKYAYFQQRYYHSDKLHAIGHVRVAMLKNRTIVPLDDLFSTLGNSVERPDEPQVIADWKQMLADKKESS